MTSSQFSCCLINLESLNLDFPEYSELCEFYIILSRFCQAADHLKEKYPPEFSVALRQVMFDPVYLEFPRRPMIIQWTSYSNWKC